MKVGIVGGGVMGEAILSRALASGAMVAADVTVAELVVERAARLAAVHDVKTTANAHEALDSSDLVILAVKPQDLGSVRGSVPQSAVIVSIMAGVTIETIARAFKHERIVRVMPNTPAAIGAGMSAWTATHAVDGAQREQVRGLLAAVGHELYVADEKKIDMATALSGSGPAYVFLFIEALIEGGVAVGLTRAQASELVIQTVSGAARYAAEAGQSPADLRAAVTSPAGTTAAGLLALEEAAFRAAVINAVRAAHTRAVELGQSK
ncbi:MAG: pyrroline-5-carboxylate reductase [Dehalococcoidia bacterium]|nr:pyrroline-5-carboxylate reductase [Dehalococcoidia bacterium]